MLEIGSIVWACGIFPGRSGFGARRSIISSNIPLRRIGRFSFRKMGTESSYPEPGLFPKARRHHIDLFTDDQEAEVNRLLALGAARKEWAVTRRMPIMSCCRTRTGIRSALCSGKKENGGMQKITVRQMTLPDEKESIAARILQSLPEWFGIPKAPPSISATAVPSRFMPPSTGRVSRTASSSSKRPAPGPAKFASWASGRTATAAGSAQPSGKPSAGTRCGGGLSLCPGQDGADGAVCLLRPDQPLLSKVRVFGTGGIPHPLGRTHPLPDLHPVHRLLTATAPVW